MKKIISALVLGLGPVSSAIAGPGGFSTIQLNWSSAGAGAGAAGIPTMSTYATLLLAVLLALVVFRVFRKRNLLVRAIAPLAAFGVAASFTVMTERPVAGIVGPPSIEGASCSGAETYTVGINPPPCFVNTCGSPVTVSYTFIAGQDGASSPITAETCTYTYFCPGESMTATDGAIVPSDGLSYATAYCEEIMGGGGG